MLTTHNVPYLSKMFKVVDRIWPFGDFWEFGTTVNNIAPVLGGTDTRHSRVRTMTLSVMLKLLMMMMMMMMVVHDDHYFNHDDHQEDVFWGDTDTRHSS